MSDFSAEPSGPDLAASRSSPTSAGPSTTPVTLSSSTLKVVAWYPSGQKTTAPTHVATIFLKTGIGIGIGFLLYFEDHFRLASIVWAVAFLVGGVSLASAGARQAIDKALQSLGRLIGGGAGAVLLAAIYVLVVAPLGFVRRAIGADDLHLRDHDRWSFWLAADEPSRVTRWVGSMFVTEPLAGRIGHPLRTSLVVLLLLVALAEGVARTLGFGHAVLYRADPIVGYYPTPNQNLARYGGALRTNAFGMRSEDIARHKAAGDLRILMLGDSTQWGGSYVDQKDIYTTRLQAALDPPGNRRHVQVLSVSANGWGPFHEHGYIKKFGTFDADIAVIDMPMDDVNRPLYGLMDAPFFGDVNPPTFALEEFLNNLTWRYRKAHAGLDSRWEHEQSTLGLIEYGNLADALHASGITDIYGAILPGKVPGMGGPRYESSADWFEPLRDVFTAHRVTTLYPQGLFKGVGTPEEIYYDDVHLNPKGHAIYAEFLLNQLKASAAYQRWLLDDHEALGRTP